MYNEKFRFIEKMQLILLTCIGGALLVAPKHYMSTEDFKGKIEKRPARHEVDYTFTFSS